MDLIGFVSRFAHILAAVTLVGGLFYICAVQSPANEDTNESDAKSTGEALRRRWARIVMLTTLFLIASGFYNLIATIRMAKAGQIELAPFYHPLIGIKILLAFVVFFLASILAGKTEAARRFQQNSQRWLTMAVFASIVIVALASALKVGGTRPVATGEEITTSDTDD